MSTLDPLQRATEPVLAVTLVLLSMAGAITAMFACG